MTNIEKEVARMIAEWKPAKPRKRYRDMTEAEKDIHERDYSDTMGGTC